MHRGKESREGWTEKRIPSGGFSLAAHFSWGHFRKEKRLEGLAQRPHRLASQSLTYRLTGIFQAHRCTSVSFAWLFFNSALPLFGPRPNLHSNILIRRTQLTQAQCWLMRSAILLPYQWLSNNSKSFWNGLDFRSRTAVERKTSSAMQCVLSF